MSSNRSRLSPPRGYRDHRASTGNVYVTSYDTLSAAQPGRATAGNISRPQSISYEAQPIRKSTHNDGKTSRTEYLVRPRTNSTIDPENRKPLTVSTKNASPPRRGSALVTSPREMSTALVPRDDQHRYLQPVSSTGRSSRYHPRHNSVTRMESDRYDDRDSRDRYYHSRGPSYDSPKQYHSSRLQPIRYEDEEDNWSYTGPREQFARDYPPRAHTSGHSRQERPVSGYDQDRSHVRQETVPQVSKSRQLVRDDRDEYGRRGSRANYDSDPDMANETSRRRQSNKGPVLHQSHLKPIHDEDGYSSARESYEPARRHSRAIDDRYDEEYGRSDRYRDPERRRERDRDRKSYDHEYDRERPRGHDKHHHRKPASRDPSPERSGLKAIATGALGSLATAGALNFLGKDLTKDKDKEAESDSGERKEHRHRRRRYRRDDEKSNPVDTEEDRHRDEQRRSRRIDDGEDSKGEEQPHRRRHSRRRSQRVGEVDDEPSPRSQSKVRTREMSQSDTDRAPRRSVPDRNPELEEEYPTRSLEQRTISPGENEDDRPRRVQLVEPVEKKDELKPKGILKPARQVPFPEDPNPIREGVAPLKDAKTDGIPTNARWTKISRVLVNPEALEKSHERFEEREDYVIVLRVLTREEIQKLAEKTRKIREERELEWQRKDDERRQRGNTDVGQRKNQASDDEYDKYDDNDNNTKESKPQLAIEPAPSQPPIDLRNLQAQNRHQNQDIPVPQMQALNMRSNPNQTQMSVGGQSPDQMPGYVPMDGDSHYHHSNYATNV